MLLTPALLCHKDTAHGTLYGIRAQMYLDVCCYGIHLGISIVMFHKSDHSMPVSRWIWTNESAPLCHIRVISLIIIRRVQSRAPWRQSSDSFLQSGPWAWLPGWCQIRGRGQTLRPSGGGGLPAEEAVRATAQTLWEILLNSNRDIQNILFCDSYICYMYYSFYKFFQEIIFCLGAK